MYELRYSDEAIDYLEKTDTVTKERILTTLERVRIRPHHHVKRLVGIPYYSLRVGNYRLILDIRQDVLIILIIKIGHRKNVYD